jgi:hypothetical protein
MPLVPATVAWDCSKVGVCISTASVAGSIGATDAADAAFRTAELTATGSVTATPSSFSAWGLACAFAGVMEPACSTKPASTPPAAFSIFDFFITVFLSRRSSMNRLVFPKLRCGQWIPRHRGTYNEFVLLFANTGILKFRAISITVLQIDR